MSLFRMIAALTALIPLCLAGITRAEQAPKPFPSFEAKRIKPPKPGTAQRITVQIDPAEDTRADTGTETGAETGAGAASKPASAPAQDTHAWFWDRVSADLANTTGAVRLERALVALESAEGGTIPAPRLQALQEIVAAQGRLILLASLEARVSPALTLAVIAVESAGRADAVSRAGALGMMQLMPETALRFGVADVFAPDQNIAGGVKYLDWLLTEFEDDPILALAGYNAGEGAVRSHAGVPPFAETRAYVPRVLAAYRIARSLCMTPPDLITDGCVFRGLP